MRLQYPLSMLRWKFNMIGKAIMKWNFARPSKLPDSMHYKFYLKFEQDGLPSLFSVHSTTKMLL